MYLSEESKKATGKLPQIIRKSKIFDAYKKRKNLTFTNRFKYMNLWLFLLIGIFNYCMNVHLFMMYIWVQVFTGHWMCVARGQLCWISSFLSTLGGFLGSSKLGLSGLHGNHFILWASHQSMSQSFKVLGCLKCIRI